MVAANLLIDAGAILALLDAHDRWHRVCVNALRQVRLPCLTSEAVLTEVFHLLRRPRIGVDSAWAFIRSGAVLVGAIEDSELQQI
jgi:predicted nucleic acid-binding protein